MFPGTNDKTINSLIHTKFNKTDYATELGGVYLGYPNPDDPNALQFSLQTANQWMTFRLKNVYDGENYYIDNFAPNTNLSDSLLGEPTHTTELNKFIVNSSQKSNVGLCVYPYLNDRNQLQKQGDQVNGYVTLLAGETLSVPIMCHYRFDEQIEQQTYKKTISFDIRTSLYSDPLNYTVTLGACNTESVQEKIARAEKDRRLSKYDSIVSNSKYVVVTE